jgi:hypothetical protein
MFIKNLVKNILETGNMEDTYIDILLKEEYLELFMSAFDSTKNDSNIFYKNSGELSFKKIINYYFFVEKRIPFNDIDTRSNIRRIFEYNIFEEVMRHYNNTYLTLHDPLIDKLLTLFGIIEYVLDKNIKVGVGYYVLYKIITTILEIKNKKIDRKLAYEFLKDYDLEGLFSGSFSKVEDYIDSHSFDDYEKYCNNESILEAVLNPDYKHKKEVIEYLELFKDTSLDDILLDKFIEKYPDIDEMFNIELIISIINS